MTSPFVILTVDDNPNNLFTLRALLKRLHDCEIVEASSGEEALARVVEREVHLILLDVQMPGMDGFETARHLQMTERTRNIPIIFITAVFKGDEFVHRGYAIGAVDYLTKPIDDNLLLNRIHLYQRLIERERSLAETVAELRSKEKALSTALNAAESANRAKSVFLSNMSHELKTPLNAIIGFTQLMEQDMSLSIRHRHQIEAINRSGWRLLSVINDVLEITRIETGRTMTKNEPFDLDGAVTAVVEAMRARAADKGLDFAVNHLGELPPFVLGDVNLLRQVLTSLLGNAVKYTEHGRIDLNLSPIGDLIRFEVSDTGPGISAEDQVRIFQPFFQTEAGIAIGEGTGLGITLSSEFVRLMGGELRVASEVGKGSTFSFTIPLPSTSAVVAPRGRAIGLEAGQEVIRILVVEDDPDNRDVIVQMLEGRGFEVRSAVNGQQAIEVFEAWHPHFIWLDLRMPVTDGFETARRIRALPGGQEVRIAVLAAGIEIEDHVAILAAGCDEMVHKPVMQERLFEVMARLLGLTLRIEEGMPETQAQAKQENLDSLSDEQCEELSEAAALLDGDAILALAEQLRTDHPEEAGVIAELVKDFRFDRVQALCDR